MIKEDGNFNLSPIERIIRVAIGLLLFYFGLKVSTISEMFGSGYYQNGTISFTIASTISKYQNLFRISGWFLGFVLVFTGANGFSPTYKLLHINSNKKNLFK
jgi:hypothetical protein